MAHDSFWNGASRPRVEAGNFFGELVDRHLVVEEGVGLVLRDFQGAGRILLEVEDGRVS